MVGGNVAAELETCVEAFTELMSAREQFLGVYKAGVLLPELILPDDEAQYCNAAWKAKLIKPVLSVGVFVWEVGQVTEINRS